MLNTDIFKFEFVDRVEERQKIDEFLSDFTKAQGHILWLHGKRGTGKSFFLTEYVVNKTSLKCVYVNTEINSSNSPGSYLKTLITALNKTADLKFISYLRANYRSIGAIGQKVANVALSLADLDDIGLDELGLTVTNYFISKHGEKESTVTTTKKYILEALKKCENLVFILDNFGQCDFTSLEIIVTTIHELLCYAHIKFIICTTDDDLEERFDIKSALAEKIPNKSLVISPFQQKQLFARMLENTFDLDESNIKLLSRAFDLCQGVPQQFKEILINLYSTEGILIDDSKARFVEESFKKILAKREISFDIDALCRQEKSAKIILETIALWGAPISTNILFDFLDFLSKMDFSCVIKEEVRNTIQTLETLHIVSRSFEGNIVAFQFEHDSLKLAVSNYFCNDRSVPFIHFSIYEYLMTLKNEWKDPYWCLYYQSLRAYHSFAAQADGWKEYNYDYGYTFYETGLYKEAISIFSRLEPVAISLSAEQLLVMGITFFYCGQYQKSDDILTNIENRKLISSFSIEQLVKLYTFQARGRLCLLQNERALSAILKAEKLNISDPHLQVIIMGTKQSILFLSHGGFHQAKEIFDHLDSQYSDIIEMADVYQSAMDYYEGEESQSLLNKGLKLANRYSDSTTEGKILNNLAFEDFRCGKYQDARNRYNKSISILKETQPHEQAYPFSNLAVISMVEGNWDQALNNIVEALFWNKSHYASLVLKTNRMLCYYYLGNGQWEKIYRELYEYISLQHKVDDKIYKKICINMALISSRIPGRLSETADILKRCHPYLATEWPHGMYRFLKLHHQVTGQAVDLVQPPDSRHIAYYCDLAFEPWLINFSHG